MQEPDSSGHGAGRAPLPVAGQLGPAPRQRLDKAIDLLHQSIEPTQRASLAGVERVQAWCDLLRDGPELSPTAVDRRTNWISRVSHSATTLMTTMHRAVALMDRMERSAARHAEPPRRGRANATEAGIPTIVPHAKREAAPDAGPSVSFLADRRRGGPSPEPEPPELPPARRTDSRLGDSE